MMEQKSFHLRTQESQTCPKKAKLFVAKKLKMKTPIDDEIVKKQVDIKNHKIQDNVNTNNNGRGSNIFQEQTPQDEYISQMGPKFNEQGELIKHTIVGNVDWFQKHLQSKRQQPIEYSNVKQSKLSEQTLTLKTSYDTFNKNLTGSQKKLMYKQKEQLRTKNQLLDEIDNIKQRILVNKQKDSEYIDKLPQSLRNSLYAQTSTLENHQQQINDWDLFMQKSASKLERDISFSQFLRSDLYRNKLEKSSTFEILSSDFERYGPRIWYMTLRNQNGNKFQSIQQIIQINSIKDIQTFLSSKKQLNFLKSDDLPSAFQKSIIGGTSSTLEFIRKPIIISKSISSMNSSITQTQKSLQFSTISQSPFQSFKSDKYFTEKQNKFKKHLEEKNMIQFDQINDIEGVYVQGQSQLERESEIIIKDKGDGFQQYKKYFEKPIEQIDETEEIIAYQFDKANHLRLPQIKINAQAILSMDSKSNFNAMNDSQQGL